MRISNYLERLEALRAETYGFGDDYVAEPVGEPVFEDEAGLAGVGEAVWEDNDLYEVIGHDEFLADFEEAEYDALIEIDEGGTP